MQHGSLLQLWSVNENIYLKWQKIAIRNINTAALVEVIYKKAFTLKKKTQHHVSSMAYLFIKTQKKKCGPLVVSTNIEGL